MTAAASAPFADVCLLLEGTYPYTPGGVSSWVHNLIRDMGDLTFHVVSLLPGRELPPPRYELPPNLVALTPVFVRALPEGASWIWRMDALFAALEAPLFRLQEGGGLAEIVALSRVLAPHRSRIGSRILLDSRPAWRLLHRMYQATHRHSSFLDYFWTWRCLYEGLFSALLTPLPPARLYHTVCTGYAGLLAARAHIETGRNVLLTEHGIYTNERRVEIAMADWLHEAPASSLELETRRRSLGDLWTRSFVSFSRACYEASDRIVTLFEGNQRFQLEDGAPPERMCVIPNAVDFARYAALRANAAPHPHTVALIGRVVPIKDVKTFIRACAELRRSVPALRAWVLGSADEDPDYARQCRMLVREMGLEATVTFHGQVRLEDYFGQIDVVALTSISEAQPLVILEAGAAGIPMVATDAGSCRELILGRAAESPPLGPGGTITPPADPLATAEALEALLKDPVWHASCSRALQERVRQYYNKDRIGHLYRELYRELLAAPAPRPPRERGREEHAWPA